MVYTKELNCLPANGRVSNYLSPYVIMFDHNLNFKKHFQLPFGSYIQVTIENTSNNTNTPIKMMEFICDP